MPPHDMYLDENFEMRAGRLLSILLLLQTRGRISATALAEAVGVSVRTIHRDIENLSAAGVPVYAVRGRAGGFELLDGWRTQLTGLTSAEAEALFLAGLPGPAEALGLGELLGTAQLKLLAALPGDGNTEPLRLRARFHLDPVGWFTMSDPVEQLEVVAAATWRDERLALRYESWTEVSNRVVDPLGVVLKAGVWYLVASSRGRVRTFRLSHVLKAAPTGHRFTRPDNFDLPRFWAEHAAAYERSRYRGRARIRVSATGAQQLRRMNAALAAAVDSALAGASPHGWTEMTIPIESLDHAAGELVKLGAEVEALEPAGLRERLSETAMRLARIYRMPPTPVERPTRRI